MRAPRTRNSKESRLTTFAKRVLHERRMWVAITGHPLLQHASIDYTSRRLNASFLREIRGEADFDLLALCNKAKT